MRPAVRLALPALLLVACVATLCGCVYLPTFGLGSSGKDVSEMVGPAGSGRPLRAGTATAADVYRLLGPPTHADPSGRAVAYVWDRLYGVAFGLCNGSDKEQYALLLQFDESGRLTEFLLDHNRVRTYWYLGLPRPILPGNLSRLQPQEADVLVRAATSRLAATRPATRP